MKLTLSCFFLLLIFIFIYPKQIGMFLNEPLGIVITLIVVCYFTYKHPILGIVFILLVIFTRNSTSPLDITYHTVPQTPATSIQPEPKYYTGFEQINQENNLRSKDSNRYSLVHNVPSKCDDGDMLCLYENIPKAFDEDYSNKKYN